MMSARSTDCETGSSGRDSIFFTHQENLYLEAELSSEILRI
jgi:hypothetical protein